DAGVRVRADAQADATLAKRLDRREAVTEVRLRRGAKADTRTGVGEQVELAIVGVRGVDDGGARSEAAGLGQELDRPDTVLGEALLDLARLLICMHMHDQLLALGVRADGAKPVRRARSHGVGGKADRDALAAQLVRLTEELVHRRLPEAGETTARIRDEEQDEGDPSRSRRLRRGPRLRKPEVVELADC